ncbi:putative lactoylglutathione lyase [Fusarium oxysporum f. sp. albedinis]|nr:putative lactoylglutathione lyase [Fusarium oxysporum f. sp. albedinis]
MSLGWANSFDKLPDEPTPGVFHSGGHYDDPPLPESDPTVGYKLNHMMMRIRDPKSTLHFYIDLMGMRTVWTMNAGPFTIYYLAYPSSELDRRDLENWSQKTSQTNILLHKRGLLELKHIHGSENPVEEGGYEISNGNHPPYLGFGHLGFTVPNVKAAVERLRDAGVRVVKDLGFNGRESIPLTEWERERGVGADEMTESYKETLKHVAHVADPNGYIVELIPQNLG